MSEISEGQLKLLYARIFDLYCEENEVSTSEREDVDGAKFVRWLLSESFGLPLIDRLRAMEGPEILESVWDTVMAALASPDAPLYFFHLFPYLSLGHRKCEPPVIGVEMNLAIKFADGLVIRHPPIGIASESASDRTCGDGHLGMAFHKMANALVKWIRTNSLQQLHDQAAAVIEQRRSATTSSTDDEAGRNQLIRLAQQPLQGGFA